MKSQLVISMVLCLTMISLVSATNNPQIVIQMNNGTVSIQGFIKFDNGLFGGMLPANFIPVVYDNISYTINCYNTTSYDSTVNATVTHQVCTPLVSYNKTIDMDFNESNTFVLSDAKSNQEYQKCVEEKSLYNTGLAACTKNLNDQGFFKDNYTQCRTDLQICNSDKTNLDVAKTKAEKDYSDNQNQRYIWAAIALAAGIFGTLYVKGFIGKKNMPQDFYNSRSSS